MAHDFAVRRATEDDIPQIVHLRVLLMQEMGALDAHRLQDFVDATRNYLAGAIPSGDCLIRVVDYGSTLVASGALVFFRRPPSPTNLSGLEAYLLNMYTLRQYRGRGMGNALLDALLADAGAVKVGRVWLHATANGRGLYTRAGFQENPAYLERAVLADL